MKADSLLLCRYEPLSFPPSAASLSPRVYASRCSLYRGATRVESHCSAVTLCRAFVSPRFRGRTMRLNSRSDALLHCYYFPSLTLLDFFFLFSFCFSIQVLQQRGPPRDAVSIFRMHLHTLYTALVSNPLLSGPVL